MIDLYTWKTPNGRKISIALEELNLSYQIHAIDIGQQQQFTQEFLAINPNHKIPAIIDADGIDGKPITVFESGAILIYLAEKTGQLLPQGSAHYQALQWLMWQVSGLGPMLGQFNHFRNAVPEKIAYAISRYETESKRLYKVLNEHLSDKQYLANEYSIADIATFPWVTIYEKYGINLNDYPNLKRWHDAIAQRPAVQRGMQIP
jgi:GSH-dependent disulfide-bond oxidoreductase